MHHISASAPVVKDIVNCIYSQSAENNQSGDNYFNITAVSDQTFVIQAQSGVAEAADRVEQAVIQCLPYTHIFKSGESDKEQHHPRPFDQEGVPCDHFDQLLHISEGKIIGGVGQYKGA